MSGYGIECWLKAELMQRLSGLGGWMRQQHDPMYDALWKHDLPAMAELLSYPTDLMDGIKSFAAEWGTALRYNGRRGSRPDAERLVQSAQTTCHQIKFRVL